MGLGSEASFAQSPSITAGSAETTALDNTLTVSTNTHIHAPTQQPCSLFFHRQCVTKAERLGSEL